MDLVTDKLGIFKTRTEGYDPHANGRAESFVGILKHRTTGHLLANRHPVSFWYWSMRFEDAIMCDFVFDINLPSRNIDKGLNFHNIAKNTLSW